MKFHFNELIIWLKNGHVRTVSFLPNKVNIITGGSNTGKTAILDIIDYCLFASKHNISESMINENASWYGIRISIGGKNYTIAREAPSKGKVSSSYYFSSVGKVPDVPVANNAEKALKQMISAEFGIDQDTKVSYGGKALRANSKISLRYFLLFNTISQNIITHSEQFFDKQNNSRYREALPRTFDLAVGIDTVTNILKKEKIVELESKLRRLGKESGERIKKHDVFHSNLSKTVSAAKEYSLIPQEQEINKSVELLRNMIDNEEATELDVIENRYEELAVRTNQLARKIRKLQTFEKEYEVYRSGLKDTSDSLKPIDYLSENYTELVRTSIFNDILIALQSDQSLIKNSIANHAPLQSNTVEIIKDLQAKKRELESTQLNRPKEMRAFKNEKEKYIFLGEVKAKLDLYANTESSISDNTDLEQAKIQKQIDDLDAYSVQEKRELFINVLDETIEDYIELTKVALENYADYKSAFNYKDKRLYLRKPKTQFIENVGSSSNHMFLHLFLFLGLHELIMVSDARHVAPFLIIDQFSRPYWGENTDRKEELDHSDISKVKAALNLLDGFISTANEHDREFQMIVFEHIGEELWEGKDNIHLVEVFRDGNALIPDSMLD